MTLTEDELRAEVERLRSRIRTLEQIITERSPSFLPEVKEGPNGYPDRPDVDGPVQWLGPHEPPIGPGKARPGDAWDPPQGRVIGSS